MGEFDSEKISLRWKDIPLVPLSNILSRLCSSRDKRPILSVCRDWSEMARHDATLWRCFEMDIQDCAKPRHYMRTRKFFKQFGPHVRQFKISGIDKHRKHVSAVKAFIVNFNLVLDQIQKNGSGLTHFTISDLAPYLSRTLTSDFSHMPSGYQKNIKNLVLRNTRFENRHGMDLLDSLVFYGMELQKYSICELTISSIRSDQLGQI